MLISEHLSKQLSFIKECQTPDTVGSMLVIFQDDGITQYGATIDPETAPAALRELADRIEKRTSVKRVSAKAPYVCEFCKSVFLVKHFMLASSDLASRFCCPGCLDTSRREGGDD